jgi:hypothetical protein
MDPQIESGKRWVETQLQELSRELAILVDGFEWERTAKDLIEGTLCLAISLGGKRRVVRFSQNDLADLEATPEIQGSLSRHLRRFLKE